MDDVMVIDVTQAGPCGDLASYQPEELPAAAKRLFWEIFQTGEGS